MKKFLIAGMVAASLFAMQLTQAATVCDAKTNLNDARTNLVAMVKMSDKAAEKKADLDALREKVNAATTALETAIAALKAEAKDAAAATTLESKWAEFKATREGTSETEKDNGIMQNVYAGKQAEAKALATGIQAERLAAMNEAIKTLGGDDCK